jgi:general secretion pathway protein C
VGDDAAARAIYATDAPETHMLDTRTNEWLSRLQGHGPRWASLALAALMVVEVGRVSYILLSGAPVNSPQPALSIVPGAQKPGVDIGRVVAAHLFGVAEVSHGVQDPANAPPSTANLLLAGTIATQDPKRGVAIVSDGGGPSKVYSVGDNVGGAALHSVYLDHVILDRGGVLETLLLPRQSNAGNRLPPLVRRGGPDPRTVAAVDNIRKMVQQDPSLLDQVMRVVPSYDNNAGKLRGFRAYPGKNRQIFGKLGLKSGDLVTAVNGTPLDDPQHSQDVFNTIQSSDRVTVTIERQGQKQDITLNIAQVAAQATQELNDPAGTGAFNGSPAAPPTPGDVPPPSEAPKQE